MATTTLVQSLPQISTEQVVIHLCRGCGKTMTPRQAFLHRGACEPNPFPVIDVVVIPQEGQ